MSGAQIDHILIGVPDRALALDELAKLFGVAPAYGGRHARGTHNALLSLGPGLYLELIALQPGATGPAFGIDLERLTRMEPVGWAVATANAPALRERLVLAGFDSTIPEAGRRATPSGDLLEWQTFRLRDAVQGAPFFIEWGVDVPHPATTSPPGCRLSRFQVSSPDAGRLRLLIDILGLSVQVNEASATSFVLSIESPEGPLTFR